MSMFGKTSHSLFFNGINDSIVCPQGGFSQTGHKLSIDGNDARTSAHVSQDGDSLRHAFHKNQSLTSFTIEAWVLPDSGGVIASKEGMFELRMGSVGAPSVASFVVHTDTGVSYAATSANNYPTNAGSFISNNTGLNTAQRELYHICGVFTGEQIKLYINGEIIASEKINARYKVAINEKDLYIGGKGGEYRGYIESLHWQRGVKSVDLRPIAFSKTSTTLGLWRFEEPVEVDDNIFHIKSAVVAGDTTLTLDTTQVQTLYQSISGKDDTFSGTYTPESLGNYRVLNSAHSAGGQVISVAHRQINLLINPTGTDINTELPNNRAPERVRLISIQSAGTITVESIHLDFNISSDTGSRGVLHARTAYDTTTNLAADSTIVIIRSDLLIDSQSGKPYQMKGTGTQMIDRTGSLVIDESGNDFHGFIYSRECSINEGGNPFTISSWTIDNNFKYGHNGRNIFNHHNGHSFLRFYPPAADETITRTIDGIADSMLITFPAAHMGIQQQIPINSQVSMSHTAFKGPIRKVITTSTTTHVVRNGMQTWAAKDGIIAIGVENIEPFLLKGFGDDNISDDSTHHKLHLMSEDESRVAIMEVSGLSIPYVEIHYNAIDLTGSKMGINKPCLLVEKTVPNANVTLGGITVAQHITNAIGSTLHSAGGVITFSKGAVGDAHTVMQSHRLVGDNTGGTENEIFLDETRTPSNYTPSTSTDLPNAPPITIASSSEDTSHPSVYHQLILYPNDRAQSDPPITKAPDHYQESQQFVSQQGAAYEVFDIIDNYKLNNEHYIIVQPNIKSRTMQLSRVVGQSKNNSDHTFATIEYIQGQGRVGSFQIVEKKGSREIVMRVRGLMSDIADQSASYSGDGSPDSHGVKEIMPGAPVVSVTLGGVGQGAINTKPSWDPSPLSRVGWNTRRGCSAQVYRIGTTTWPHLTGTVDIEVVPLNNESGNLASWGTYCFPPTGKVYLRNGGYAHYESRDGTSFTFDIEANQYAIKFGYEGVFVNANGKTANTFANWIEENNIGVGTELSLDNDFNTQSVCDDGTTVNDRLFQSLGTISHDYQLGTQYASTRALVEIPLFPNQFFENRDEGIFPGPDNSMKIHLDATLTAHTWNPSPVGRRATNKAAIDHEAHGPYYERLVNNEPIRAEVSSVSKKKVSGEWCYFAYLKDGQTQRVPKSSLTATGDVRYMNSQNWLRKVILDNGEWCYYAINDDVSRLDTTNNRIQLLDATTHHSDNFFQDIKSGSVLSIGELPFKVFESLATDNTKNTLTSANEYRNPFYYDRANVQTSGGNVDYGLRQYVSAVEFKAGPLANPHLSRIESGVAQLKVLELTGVASPQVLRFEGNLPKGQLPTDYRYKCINLTNGDVGTVDYNSSTSINEISVYYTLIPPVEGDILIITGIVSVVSTTYPYQIQDGCVNHTWNYPYCPGGLRYGDTIWMNMHYTNPHAIEGLFAKSRGVLNEYQVWTGFNGGKGDLDIQARDSLPVENFLIGDTCLETARNFVQHVNKTIELNWADLGHATDPPVVAYLDPYLSTEQHARVLLYDVAHDREFIAFQDIQMQVQSSATTPQVNELDVAAGFATQRKDKDPNHKIPTPVAIGPSSYSLESEQGHSTFIEGQYAHSSWYLMDEGYRLSSVQQYVRPNRQTQHYVKTASVSSTEHDRVEPSVSDDSVAQLRHAMNLLYDDSALVRSLSPNAYKFTSRFFDTPDGTRVVPAFLCMKGNRATNLSLSNHAESRLQHTPHWYAMDFTRRLSLDLGEVGIKEGVTDIEAAAKEVVRLINQAGAKNGRSSQRRPSDQYAGEGERFDINRRAVSASGIDTFEPSDPTSAHHHADFATTGSTHDPAAFWDGSAFTSYDRGSHMGYLRAHTGRVVTDIDGNEGYSIVIHSTIPGASGRNFCAWLDNSKGQTEYKPQFLLGHGGRFHNFFCSSPEINGENMHPAPMPIDKNGKPFAPITTLRQYVQVDELNGDVINSQNLGYDVNLNTNTIPNATDSTPNSEATTGRNSNTINMESFEEEGQKYTVREGLQKGLTAKARINFGGMVASGIPGFAPDAGKWGFGENYNSTSRFQKIYGQNIDSGNTNYANYTDYVPTTDVDTDNIGVGTNLYGLKLTDHRGKNHIIRYVYRQEGETFTHKNSPIPPTIDEEIIIHFDDRDVAQGGFTIGNRMWGLGAQGTPVAPQIGSTYQNAFRGNTFRGVHAPNNGYAITVGEKTTARSGPLTAATVSSPSGTGAYTALTTYPTTMQSRLGGSIGTGATVQVTVNGGGQVTGVSAIISAGSAYAIGDVLTILGGTNDATITVSAIGVTATYAHPNSLILETGVGIGNDDTGIWHRLPDPTASALLAGNDVLGWLGFPDSGLIWLSIDDGSANPAAYLGDAGVVFYYSSRTHNDKDGEHGFFGLRGVNANDMDNWFSLVAKFGPLSSVDNKNPVILSPYLNQTTLITDELMAAATAAAFDFKGSDGEIIAFDCSDMFAPDGRTYREWMGDKAQTAVKIKAFNNKKDIQPLSDLFNIELSRDWGILSSSTEADVSASTAIGAGTNIHMGGLTRTEINEGVMFDAGYIPKTLLNITTRYRGYNANTATPVIIDYNNNPINTIEWKNHLRGIIYTMYEGDHITPSFNNLPIKMNEPAIGPLVFVNGNTGNGMEWEEGVQYVTETTIGSGSGARHSVLFDWRGPRLADQWGSRGDGYAVGDAYDIYHYKLVVGSGPIGAYTLGSGGSLGYVASPPLPAPPIIYTLIGGMGAGATVEVSVDAAGRVTGITNLVVGTGYAIGDVLSIQGLGSSNDATIIVESLTSSMGTSYVANTTYDLKIGGVLKGKAQFNVDATGALTSIIQPVDDIGPYGYSAGQDYDVVDPLAIGSGGKVQIRHSMISNFTVDMIEGVKRVSSGSHRWDAGGDFLLGPYGREASFQETYLDSNDDLFTAASGFPYEISWVSPTKLYLTDSHSILVHPVGDKMRFLDNDMSENIELDVLQTAIRKTKDAHSDIYYGIDGDGLQLYAQRIKGLSASGIRLAGNARGIPLIYFRGAHDSVDHNVPLYFGGGFSGVTMDINDGSRTDYTSHNEHPYASGPTGCAGMQNVGENMGSYALLDTTAMMAMFPGTPLCDQMRGASTPPYANQDAILTTDMDGGLNTHAIPTRTYTNVNVVKPSPIILRFAHPYARYGDSENSVAYVIFGPGQAVPKHWRGESQSMTTSTEISSKWVVAAKHYMTINGSPNTYLACTEAGLGLPNEMSNTTLRGGANQFLPKTEAYRADNVFPYNAFSHWEPPIGSPNLNYNQNQPGHALYVSNHFGSTTTLDVAASIYAHPYSHYNAQIRFASKGISLDPVVDNKMQFHLDGGYTPGGSWFDDTVRKNPPHPETGSVIAASQTTMVNGDSITTGLNATMFRVGAQLASNYDTNADETEPPADTFLIDATRCQNSEELGAVIAAAINTWPGPANLKAIGGTFLPSMQDAQRQDKYSWVDLLEALNYDEINGIVTCVNQIPDTIPENGWIRVSDGADAFYGYYSHRTKNDFILGANYRSGLNVLEDPTASTAATGVANGAIITPTPMVGHKVYVWSKSGNLRWDNGFQTGAIPLRDINLTTDAEPTNSAYDHFAATQVHFSGVVDAIDRTRPIGAIGWHGERYSYLNSLDIEGKVAAGLGAWNPSSGFTPYGPSMNCHTINSIKYTIIPDLDHLEISTYQIVPVVEANPAVSGLHQRHYIAISYEGDLPIIAKAAREGQNTCGDMLSLRWSDSKGGTVVSYHSARFNNDHYNAESNAGPHVEALHEQNMTIPTELTPSHQTVQSTQDSLFQMETCLFPTGDLFYDKLMNPGIKNYSDGIDTEKLFDAEVAITESKGYNSYNDHLGGVLTYWKGRNAGRNMFTEHVVWKRMSGGNLTLPAPNARGLGAIPWTVHKADDGNYYKFGETIYGNTRFTFETTNSAMFPIIQAQELAHPSLAEQFPHEIRNALTIPNEEEQFKELIVVDDTGQEHILAGGSPLGIVIRDYELLQDRETQGLAPALAGSGEEPNMKLKLPNHDEIPSNILIRTGFDRLQAYQHETMGDGGLQHPSQPSASVTDAFGDDGLTPKTAPNWEQEGYEHIDAHPNTFPDSKISLDDDNILKTAYEPHDRALYFHITKMGYTYSQREPLGIVNNLMTRNALTVVSVGSNTITASGAIIADIWKQDPTSDGRYFLAINGTIASFENISGDDFTNVVFAPDFIADVGDDINPSYYIPAGTTRHYAARRLRDHAEVSGNSPDKPLTDWADVGSEVSPASAVRMANKLTPMPLPRMGHHYVMPTMAIMPGHLAHPTYQIVGDKAFACNSATTPHEQIDDYDDVKELRDTLIWFSGVTAPNPPSDIHGDGFTLLTETKIRFDGYGIADESAACNKAGGHRIRLESGANYNTAWNFPDPLEVGAYQIIIQPNLFSQQLMGNNENTSFGSTDAPENPSGTNTTYTLLTDQLVATVIAIQWEVDRYDLILSDATMADVRGCEIYLNEIMLDMDPSSREQFTNIPVLGLQNPFGINASTSGALTRRSLPYHPNMFRRATPTPTITIPWWSVAYEESTVFSNNKWINTEHYHPDDYYLFCRSTLGGVGCQLTMTGYPSHYLDVYTEYLTSLTPTCTIKRLDISGGAGAYKIFVDNNALFPLVGSDYKNHKLQIEGSDGVIYQLTYTNRGYNSNPVAGSNTTVFEGVTASTYTWSKLAVGQTVRLTGPSATLDANEVYTKSESSVATRNLPQLLSGTRDTNTANPPDAYLCLWHYNLGRPMTWFSDSRALANDPASDKKPYNHLPEHFETVHYHEFVYAMSNGPFKFRMRGWDGPGDGLVETWTDTLNYPNQAGVDGMLREYHYGSFWPGGHRFGAQMSSMTLYGTAAIGWGTKDGSIQYDIGANKGLEIAEHDPTAIIDIIGGVPTMRRVGVGCRVSVRQPYNRPKWAIKGGQSLRDPYASYHYNVEGPFVSQDAGSGLQFAEDNVASSVSASPFTTSYTGIIERHTNAAALIGSDLQGQQVKYSDGRRMTKSFGCAVRNIINPSTSFRLYHGDTPAGLEGTNVVLQRVSLALAQAHYMIDWWGNTTGEEVRRFPARGFGIRPSWDPQDAYDFNDRTKTPESMIAQRSTVGSALSVVNFYDPASAKRIGDRGDGRGCRWPTVFNEDVLQSVDTPIQLSGMVLSHHTSEPPFTAGFIRASNVTLENHEVPRGISNRLDISADDGLLKPAAMVGSNTASTEDDFLPSNMSLQEPISRASPRVGIDAHVVGEQDKTYGIIGTEAVSLHTDRAVGQRFILEGGIHTTSRALSDFDMTVLNLSSAKQVMRFGQTHGVPVMGGSFILEVSSYLSPISDLGWGRAGASAINRSSNPYQTVNHDSLTTTTNTNDKNIKFLIRPVRVLDNKHIELFRSDKTHVLSATAGGRYGMFTYDAPSARANDPTPTFMRGTNPSPTNAPYPPVYLFDLTASTNTPVSFGPKIPGSKSTTFVSNINQAVARMIVSSNTLQHYRGDASRKQAINTSEESFIRHNYSIQPRFTQLLYPGDNQNSTTHSGESDRIDNELD
jgi:hypothetical protein